MTSATRSKRWNGNFDTLPAAYLQGVAAKMGDYGDRVQFSLVTPGAEPSYQIMTALGKTMAFDRKHHLLHPQPEEFAGANASAVFTLDQIKAGMSGVRAGSRTTARAGAGGGSGKPRTTAAALNEQFAAQRYEYFRNNRQTLPATITEHSDEITELMKKGKSVEEAFSEVIKKYF